MQHLNRALAAGKTALNVQQAAHVATGHGFRARSNDIVGLFVCQCGGYFGVLYAERAAESATAVTFFHLDEREAGNGIQQQPWLSADAEAPRKVAGIVIGDRAFKRRAELGSGIGNAQYVNKVLCEFEGLTANTPGLLAHDAVVCKQIRIMVSDHMHAGTGGADNGLRLFKQLHKSAGRSLCLTTIATVEGRLAAAGLLRRVMHGYALAVQYRGHAFCGIRKHGVDETLYEKVHVSRSVHVESTILKNVAISVPDGANYAFIGLASPCIVS